MWQDAFWTWCRVAALSFGGPTGQIAVMHRILVEEKKWISEHRFLHALNYCMLLPGPEAQQLATYIGWLLHGTRGGLLSGTLFILPGFRFQQHSGTLNWGFADGHVKAAKYAALWTPGVTAPYHDMWGTWEDGGNGSPDKGQIKDGARARLNLERMCLYLR